MRPTRAPRLAALALLLFAAHPAPAADTFGLDASTMVIADPGRFRDLATAEAAAPEISDWGPGSRDADAATVAFAAAEVRRWLARSLRVDEGRIAWSGAARLPARGDVVLLAVAADDPRLAGLRLPPPPTDPEGYRLDVIARAGGRILVVRGGSRVGVLYGGYELLNRLGVHFDGLGDTGTILPARPQALPSDLSATGTPAFATRGFWAWEPRGTPEMFLWMARNRINLWTVEQPEHGRLHQLGIRLVAGGHSIQKRYLDPRAEYRFAPGDRRATGRPREPYGASPTGSRDADGDGRLTTFEAHPEWYGLHDGRRSDRLEEHVGDNFCTSNADARRELVSRVVDDLASGPWRDADALALWMLDNGRWCSCAPCRAQGEPTDRLLVLLAEVRDGLDRARRQGRLRRDVHLSTLAFLETMAPPTRPPAAGLAGADVSMTWFPIWRCYAHALADPACQEINRLQRSEFEAWAGRRDIGSLAVGEYYNVSSFKSLPAAFLETIATDLPWYARQGVRHFTYMHAPSRDWGTWACTHVLLARLLWDPTIPGERIVSAFVARNYPSSDSLMRSFYGHLDVATRNLKLLKHEVRLPADVFLIRRQMRLGLPVLQLRHLQGAETHPPADDAPDLEDIERAMTAARRELDAALARTTEAPERARLVDVERRFAYGESMLKFLDALIRAYEFARLGQLREARAAWVEVEAWITRLRSVRDLVQVASSDCNARDGYEATEMSEIVDRLRPRLAARPGR